MSQREPFLLVVNIIEYVSLATFVCPHLANLVDGNDTRSRLLICSDKDRVATNTVHVEAHACFQIIDVDKAHLCHKIDDTVLFSHLQSHREIGRCFWRKEDFNGFFLKRRVVFWMIDFNDL